MARALVGLGANLGDRSDTLSRAIGLLAAENAVALQARSGWHETEPIGGSPGQEPFLNGAALVDTSFAPAELLETLRRIETQLGRTPGERWDARPIDLDLLLYESEVIATPALTVPHPRMAFRRFVLEPAAEVAPRMVHPKIEWSVAELLEHLRAAVPYVALLGSPNTGKRALAQSAARTVDGRFLPDPATKTTAAAAADSSGHTVARQIQFLGDRAKMLNRAAWPEGSRPVVSDFHFDQCLAYARPELSAADYHAFHAAWQAASADVMPPKLTVLLGDAVLTQSRLAQEIAALASRPGLGPMLDLRGQDPTWQHEELVAAIRAMQ